MTDPVARLLDEVHDAMVGAGLSQAELARRMGSAPPVISEVFSGARNPTLDYVRRMWQAINDNERTT